MISIFLSFLTFLMQDKTVLYHFPSHSEPDGWAIVDDDVMGGKSDGVIGSNDDGYGVFQGSISLANNGGFSSVRLAVPDVDAGNYSHVVIRLKGDGKPYQFRIKRSRQEPHSYVYAFNTTGKWEEIRIPYNQLTPAFRGRTLDLPEYKGGSIAEIGFLFGNKKEESFKLLLESISLE